MSPLETAPQLGAWFRSTTRLVSVEWPVTEMQRSFDLCILERQVTAAADIPACNVTGSNQP
jgi:hypothetical protein